MNLKALFFVGACMVSAPAIAQSTQFGVNMNGGDFGQGHLPGVYGTDYIYPSSSDYTYFTQNGLALVRLPFRMERVQPNGVNTTLDPTEIGRIKDSVSAANAAGASVVLDMHNYARYFTSTLGDSTFTIAALANVWSQLATAFKGVPGVIGYDIMNEPHDLPAGVWPSAAQAAVSAIRMVDTVMPITVEGDCWSGAENWQACNGTLNIKDPSNKIIYSAHIYFDRDFSGTYNPEDYASQGGTPTIGADHISGFVSWLTTNGFHGSLGEYGIPDQDGTADGDALWLTALDNMLTAADKACISGTYWGAGPWWPSTYPLSVQPVNGVARPQMAILEKHKGIANCTASTTPPPTYTVSPDGTRIDALKTLVDKNGVSWTVDNAGLSYENGVADGGANIVYIIIVDGVVYASTTSYGWWTRGAYGWYATHNPLPAGP